MELVSLYLYAKKNKKKICKPVTLLFNQMFPDDKNVPLLVKWHRITRYMQIEELKQKKKKIPDSLIENYKKSCESKTKNDLYMCGLELTR